MSLGRFVLVGTGSSKEKVDGIGGTLSSSMKTVLESREVALYRFYEHCGTLTGQQESTLR
jgi:hypothetical protein